MNKNSFSKAIGMTNNVTIGRIINENTDPSFDVLKNIVQHYGSIINVVWLITGEGEMLLKKAGKLEKVSTVAEPGTAYCNACQDKAKVITMQEDIISLLKEKIENLRGKLPDSKSSTDPPAESLQQTG